MNNREHIFLFDTLMKSNWLYTCDGSNTVITHKDITYNSSIIVLRAKFTNQGIHSIIHWIENEKGMTIKSLIDVNF